MRLLCSVGFWGGLLVMGFIAWAWRDSRYHDTRLRYRAWEIQHMRSVLVVKYHSGGRPRVIEEFTRGAYEPDDIKPIQFPPPSFAGTGGGRVSTRILRLPHATMFGGTVLVWAGFLWWRARAIKRAQVPLQEGEIG